MEVLSFHHLLPQSTLDLQSSRGGVPVPPAGSAASGPPTETHRRSTSHCVGATLSFAALAVPVLAGLQRRRKASHIPRRFNPDLAKGDATLEELKSASVFTVISDTQEFRELDRRSRRPVFGYSDWVNHRSADRFLANLSTIFVSRIAKSIWLEVLTPTFIAFLTVLYYEFDWQGLWTLLAFDPDTIAALGAVPTVTVTALPFTLVTPSLSLLLVFKTNSAYGRWWEARKVWGSVVNKCRDNVRQALARIKPEYADVREEMTRLTASFPYILAFHLSEQTPLEVAQLQSKLEELLTPEEAEAIMSAVHKPMTVCGMMSDALQKCELDLFDKMKMDQVLSDFADYYGMCERIFKTPIPLFYTRHTARFLSFWLMGMPFALYPGVTPHWLIIPITFFISSFIFGIEELGMQIEEPFSVLPLEKISNGIEASLYEALRLNKASMLEAKSHATVIAPGDILQDMVDSGPPQTPPPPPPMQVQVSSREPVLVGSSPEPAQDEKKKRCSIM